MVQSRSYFRMYKILNLKNALMFNAIKKISFFKKKVFKPDMKGIAK